MNRNRYPAVVVAFVIVAMMTSLFRTRLEDYVDGIVRLDDSQLLHARGLDRSKYITGSYTCEQSTADDDNFQTGGLLEFPADGCPSDPAGGELELCVSCDPPGTADEFIVRTDLTGTLHPPGIKVHDSVTCGPKKMGFCGFDANSKPICEDLEDTSTSCSDITEYYNQPPPDPTDPTSPWRWTCRNRLSCLNPTGGQAERGRSRSRMSKSWIYNRRRRGAGSLNLRPEFT